MGIYELINGIPEPSLTEEQLIEQQKAVKHWEYRRDTHGVFYSLDLFFGYPIAIVFDKEYSLKHKEVTYINRKV